MAEPVDDPYRELINTMVRQRQQGVDMNDLWRRHANAYGEFFQDAVALIRALAVDNDQQRERLDMPEGQRQIEQEARWQVWDIVEGTYTTEEMRLAHPEYYHRYLSPAVQAEDRRIAEALDRLSDPDFLGEQAEQRFYAEQDPDSEWYRADLYHGQPGPDVQATWDQQEDAFDEVQRRLAAGEPLSAEEDLRLARMRESPEARQARYYDAWEMSDAGIAAQDREIERFAARQSPIAPEDDPPFRPEEGFVVDASQPERAEDFQALLARLDQRLEALIQATEGQTQALTPKQGVRY